MSSKSIKGLPQEKVAVLFMCLNEKKRAVEYYSTLLSFLDAGHGGEYIEFDLLNTLLHGKTFVNIHIGDAAFPGTDNAVALARQK